MKKSSFIFLFCLLAIVGFSQNDGHYSFSIEDKKILAENVEKSFSNWFKIDNNSTFEITKDEFDGIGMQHIVYQQYYKGIKVEHGVVFVHVRDGFVVCINATIMELPLQIFAEQENKLKSTFNESVESLIIPVNTKNGVVYRLAYKLFDNSQNADVYYDAETRELLKTNSHVYNGMADGEAYTMYNGWQSMTSYYNTSQDAYYLYDEDRQIWTLDASSARYKGSMSMFEITSFKDNCKTYRSSSHIWGGVLSSVKIISDDGDWWYTSITDTRPDFYIKVYNSHGELLYKSETIDNTKSPVIFMDINVVVDKGSYIEIYDEDAIVDSYGGRINISDIEPSGYTWNGSYTTGEFWLESNPALDAHWGMQKVYDYYLNTFNRKSFNNLGTAIYNFINPIDLAGGAWNNACAGVDYNGVGYMLYGLGDGWNFSEVVALDVMAHEFTHNVTQFNGNGGLEYIGESGALNESFSDIFGCAIEFYALGDKADWLIGEDCVLAYKNLRSMSSPKDGMDGEGAQPDTYKGDYWADVTDFSDYGDNGGVHTNSGVQNKWFYLLCEGGSGTNDNGDSYTVKGIGIEKAQRIAYRDLMFYLTPTATYWDSRNGSLNAAKDLYGENSVEYKAVEDAWFAVGVGSINDDFNKFVLVASSESLAKGYVMGSGLYNLNEEATLIAVPEEGYEFSKWSDGNTINPRKIIVTSDTTFKALFKDIRADEAKKLTLFSNNNEWGIISGEGEYSIGEKVLISAIPQEGFRFVQWSDGNTQQQRLVTIEDDLMLIATFEKVTLTSVDDEFVEGKISVLNKQILVNDETPRFVINPLGQKVVNQNLKPGCYYVQIGNTVCSVFVE